MRPDAAQRPRVFIVNFTLKNAATPRAVFRRSVEVARIRGFIIDMKVSFREAQALCDLSPKNFEILASLATKNCAQREKIQIRIQSLLCKSIFLFRVNDHFASHQNLKLLPALSTRSIPIKALIERHPPREPCRMV